MISQTPRIVPFFYGNGSSLRVGTKAKELGMTKVIVIFDKGVEAAGVVAPILNTLKKSGIEYVTFNGVIADPPDYSVDECGKIAREASVNGIIAVGGGSSMDTAKGCNVLINNDLPINQWFSPKVAPGAPVPLIAIPTTAGTGSEATRGAIITDSKAGKKSGISGEHGTVTFAIIDPELYVGMPTASSVYCAYDAFTHCVDSICSNHIEPISQALAEKAINQIVINLPKVIENGKDLEARGELALAATYGGITMMGVMAHLTHCVGHSIGTVLHIPHGYCCMVCMPQLIKLYSNTMPDRVKVVAKAMMIDIPENVSNEELGNIMYDAMLDFMRRTGYKPLKEWGYTLEQIMNIVPMMPRDIVLAYAPILLSGSKFGAMVKEAYDL